MTVPGPDLARVDRVGRITLVLITLAMLLVLGRVLQVQIRPDLALSEHIEPRVGTQASAAPRGDLRDRRGRLLAATRQGYRLFVDPSELQPPYGDTIQALARLTGLDAAEVGTRLMDKVAENVKRAAAGRKLVRYVSVGGVLPDRQLDEARRLKIRGVSIEPRLVRELAYDDSSLEPIIGVVGIDHDGLLGAERTFDRTMRPTPGHMSYVRSSGGSPLWLGVDGYASPKRGGDVRLSIDAVLQRIGAEELAAGVERADAAGGRLLMVDPATGEIVAMVDHIREMPGLTEWRKGQPMPTGEGIRFKTIIADTPAEPGGVPLRRNRTAEDIYEPGSTFKPFVWSILTERGYCKPDEWFNTHDGRWATDFGRGIYDVTPKLSLTWREVLVYSSNIGMVQGAFRQPFLQTRSDLLRFGFGRKTGVGLPGESNGIVTSAKDWSKYTQSSIPSGYEIAVTPMQMVRAFSVFAREGDLMGTIPTLRLTAPDPAAVETEIRTRVLPARVVHEAREAMRQVAENMETRTRQYFADDLPCPYPMFGKSGTAEIPRPGGGGYFDGQYNSSFIAAAPADQPRLVVLVIIDDPGPEQISKRMHYGSAVAGPVVRQVVRRSLEYLGVSPPPVPDDNASEIMASTGGSLPDEE